MTPPWNLDDLEIVGYADVLKETMLPGVVPPVDYCSSRQQPAPAAAESSHSRRPMSNVACLRALEAA